MADLMPAAPDVQPPTLSGLEIALWNQLPNRCCDAPDCPYDRYDAHQLSLTVLEWLAELLEQPTTRLGQAAGDPGSIVRRAGSGSREVLAHWMARAVKAEILRAAREV